VGAIRGTRPSGAGDGGNGSGTSRLPWLQCALPIAAATKDFAVDCLLGEFEPIRCFRRGADRGGNGAPRAVAAVAGAVHRSDRGSDGRRGSGEWNVSPAVAVAGLSGSRAGVAEWTAIVLAASVGMILAALFALLLATCQVRAAPVRRSDPTHYAVPAERPEPGRTSSITVGQIVSGGGY
jgi:hypothetical protein